MLAAIWAVTFSVILFIMAEAFFVGVRTIYLFLKGFGVWRVTVYVWGS